MSTTTAITVLGLAEGVCKATSSLIDVFNSGRQLRRKEMTALRISIESFVRSELKRLRRLRDVLKSRIFPAPRLILP